MTAARGREEATDEAEEDAPPSVAEIRDLGAPEVTALAAALHPFGDDLIARLESRWTLKVLVRADTTPHRRIVAVARARLADLAPYAPIHLGIPVAHLSRQGARLTLEGGRLITPWATRRVVGVLEKAATVFLYGRHILARGVGRASGKPTQGDEVLVVDTRDGRYLGIGVAQLPMGGPRKVSGSDPDAVAVKNRLDLGLYLRAQQGVPE